MTTHHLKCWPTFFAAVKSGDKPFEIRSTHDREFRVGDVLELEEFEPCKHCGGEGRVSHELTGGSITVESDRLCLVCWGGKGEYTGQSITRLVTFILYAEFGIKEGFVCMGLKEATV